MKILCDSLITLTPGVLWDLTLNSNMIIKNQVMFQYLLHGSVADKDARLTDVDAVTAIEM
jgi:hypothetical protein